jgi:parvulin-like peptidyl-prolyl isomerase
LKKKVLITLLILESLLNAKNICVNNDFNVDKEIIKIQKSLLPNGKYYTDGSVRKVIKEEKFYADEYIKKYGIDSETKKALALSINKTLAQLLKNKLIKKYSPDDKVLKSFYYDHIDEFKPETEVSVSSITLLSLDKADEIYSKLKKDPSKFEEMAKKYSIKDNTVYKNVEISKFALPVREWIRKAKPGDISEPIKLGKIYVIDRLDSKKEIKPTYENLKPFIKNILVNIYVNKLMKQMYEDAK